MTHFEVNKCLKFNFSKTYPSSYLARFSSHHAYSSRKWPQVGHFKFDQVEICTVYPHLKTHILFNSNGLAILHSFLVNKHVEVKNGSRSAILNLIKLKLFMVYPYLKLHNLFNSNGLAIWSPFPDIMNIKKIMGDNPPFWPP